MRKVKMASGMVLKVTYKHNDSRWTAVQLVEVNDTPALSVINKKDDSKDFLHWIAIYERAMVTAARVAVKKYWTTSSITVLSVERVENI